MTEFAEQMMKENSLVFGLKVGEKYIVGLMSNLTTGVLKIQTMCSIEFTIAIGGLTQMANTCISGITFYSKNYEEIEKLRKQLVDIYDSGSYASGDWCKDWIGNFVQAFYPDMDLEKIDCKGTVDLYDATMYYCSEGYYYFLMSNETAYTAKMGIWAHIVKDFFPDVKIAYISEEYGWDYFTKWDETGLFRPEKTYVDIHFPIEGGGDEYIEDHYCWDVNNLTEWCEKYLPFTFERKETLTELGEEIDKKLKEIDEDFYCQAETFAEIPPEDYDWRY